MGKIISTESIDLKTSYILISIIPCLTGLTFIFFSAYQTQFSNNSIFHSFGIAQLIIGVISIAASVYFIPFCYKVEIEGNNIIISKNERLLITDIQKRITVHTNQIKKVTPVFFGFGLRRLNYIHLKSETEFGKKIAFLSNDKIFFDETTIQFLNRKIKQNL